MATGQTGRPARDCGGSPYETCVRRGVDLRRNPAVRSARRAGAAGAAAPRGARRRKRACALREAQRRPRAAPIRAAGPSHSQRHGHDQPRHSHLRRPAGGQRRGGLVGLRRTRLRLRLRQHRRERARRAHEHPGGDGRQRRDRRLPRRRREHRVRPVGPLVGRRRLDRTTAAGATAGDRRAELGQELVRLDRRDGAPLVRQRRRDASRRHRYHEDRVDHLRHRAHHHDGTRAAGRRDHQLLER